MKHEDSLSITFNTEIRPFIDVIDTLRKIGLQQDIPLPNVVVVGDQSSGKSSIIEALSGVQLPRGKGIVTRCPLELQLIRVLNSPWMAKLSYQSNNGSRIEYKIESPSAVEEYIRHAQNDICGVGKGVSDKVITLRIESPATNAPDLTLIDLPGIARIALADQATDICQQIRQTIMGYVKPKNTVILCIISAMLDIAVNESINIAKKVDPHGERTIGVITKPDLADDTQKQEVICILNNQRIDLKKGFSMVKCRSQKELEEMMSLEVSTENERNFFENDDIYRRANKNQLGTMNLAEKISHELVDVIKESLPCLKSNIDSELIATQQKLDKLPGPVPETVHEKRTYLTKIIWNFNADIKKFLNEGLSRADESNLFVKWRTFSVKFRDSVKSKNKTAIAKKFSQDKLEILINNSRGRELSFFYNFNLFEKLVTTLILTYEVDAIDMAKNANSLVEESIMKLIEDTCKHLPQIERELKSILKKESVKCLDTTNEKIKFVFRQERYAFTMDKVFEKELENLQKEELEGQDSNGYTSEKLMDEFNKGSAKAMLDMIKIYLKIVSRRLCDVIPMTIHNCSLILLNECLAQNFLEFATLPGIEEKIIENKKVHEERRILSEKIERLHKAQIELSGF